VVLFLLFVCLLHCSIGMKYSSGQLTVDSGQLTVDSYTVDGGGDSGSIHEFLNARTQCGGC
jgi:hypothetical protein